MPTIGEIGEDALIRLFAPHLPRSAAELVGPGDDAAVIALEGNLVASSDTLIEGGHFRREWSTAADVGYRAAMQNLADIDAMGATPVSLQVSLGAPASLDAAWVVGLAEGLREACEPHGVGVSGGDLVRSATIVVAVTALGEMRGRRPVLRSGAVAGDEIAVSGPLGGAFAGFFQYDTGVEIDADARALFRRPQPRIGAGVDAAEAGAHALIDISDGLLRDLGRVAAASGVGVDVDAASVPIAAAALAVAEESMVDPRAWALTGGEDHHLVGSFAPGEVPRGWTVVGAATDAHEGVWVDGQPPSSLGWDHFTS